MRNEVLPAEPQRLELKRRWSKVLEVQPACRSLLTQEGICLTLDPGFRFLEVAYPYVARRLLTDEDPALRERLIQACLSRHTAPTKNALMFIGAHVLGIA